MVKQKGSSLVSQLWRLFNRRERWQLGLLFLALVLRAALMTVGVASIMPFMSVVADRGIVRRNAYLAAVYEWFGFTSVDGFVFSLGVAVFVFIVASNAISALTTYGIVRFSSGMNHRLSVRLMAGYLSQPYSFFVQRNSAKLHKTLLGEVSSVLSGVIIPILDVGSRVLMVAALLLLIVFIDPVLASVTAGVLGSVYGILYLMIKRRQRQLGQERVIANELRYKASAEAFGGIKDVKILQREKAFLDRFKPASWRYVTTTASNSLISQLPNYLLDSIAFGGIILVVLYYLREGGGVVEILPVISLYALAGYRLMPEVKKLFSDFSKVRFHRAALDDFLEDYTCLPSAPESDGAARLPFAREIKFRDVTFRYPEAAMPALDRVSLRIQRNQTVGLVGASGSGKTTLVDLLLGLYEPDEGRILVDGVPVDHQTLSAWRRQIGYVPQHIFLTDDSIAANIAFGVPPRKADHGLVERAARIAHLHEFITTLPAGYETVVGESGVRLSGGQRQRIGIARALYHDPGVLVMDEATSALDGATENAVMEAIHELAGKKTIILIAHRLTTLRDCDLIYILDGGRIQQTGTYRSLLQENGTFREFAGVNE